MICYTTFPVVAEYKIRRHLDKAGVRQDGGVCFLLKLHPAIHSYVKVVLALEILAIVHFVLFYLIDIFCPST